MKMLRLLKIIRIVGKGDVAEIGNKRLWCGQETSGGDRQSQAKKIIDLKSVE